MLVVNCQNALRILIEYNVEKISFVKSDLGNFHTKSIINFSTYENILRNIMYFSMTVGFNSTYSQASLFLQNLNLVFGTLGFVYLFVL